MATVSLDDEMPVFPDPVEFQDWDVSGSEQPPAASNSWSREQNPTPFEQEPLLDNGDAFLIEMPEQDQREETERSVVDQPSSTMRNKLWRCVRKCDLKTFLQKIPQPYFGMIYIGFFLWVVGDFFMDIYLSAPATGKYSLFIENLRAAILAVGVLLSWPLLLLYPKIVWAKGRVNEDEINDLLWKISKYEVLHAVYESIPQCCISLFILINEGSFHFLDVVRIVISMAIAVMIIRKFLADSSARCREKFNVLNYGFCETMCLVILFTAFRVNILILTNNDKSTGRKQIQGASAVQVASAELLAFFASFYLVLWLRICCTSALVPIGFHSSRSSNLGYVERKVDDQYCLQFMFSAASMIPHLGHPPQNTFVFAFSAIISVVYMVLKVGPKRAVRVVTFATLFCLIPGVVVLAIIPKIFHSVVVFFLLIAFLVYTIVVVVRHNFPGCSRSIAARLNMEFSF